MGMVIDVLPFKQEGMQMYAGVLTAEELLGISDVDFWHQEGEEEAGYQRPLSPTRAGEVARYLDKDTKPLLPTSVMLSYRGKLPVKKKINGVTSEVELPDGETFWIVDGQHRAAGLKKVISEMDRTRFKDYPVPIVIVEFETRADEANQFRVINETMKKVDTGLARRLLAQLRAGVDPGGRRKLKEQYEKRIWEMNAVEIVKILNDDKASPWHGRVSRPTEKKAKGQVKELSFQTSLKPILTTAPYRTWPADRLARVLAAYWAAWENMVPEAFENPDDYVLLKTPGLFSLHEVALHVLEVLRVQGTTAPDADDFYNVLKDLDQFAKAEYWGNNNYEGAALAGSMKGFALLAEQLVEQLAEAGHSTDV